MQAPSFDNTYARLPDGFFSRVAPEPAPKPELLRMNEALARELGIDPAWLASPDGLGFLSGNQPPDGSEPLSMVYAGHQFGGWSGQLGDGRAILLGEVVGPDGQRRDIQLKGSGRTPYSRGGDGKAPIDAVLREYLVSEAMAALGVPTTRALAAVTTGETIQRDGSTAGAVLARVASSHVRVGTFEFFRASGQVDALRQLADYVIDRHYPEARASDQPYRDLYESILRRSAALIAGWMQLGFVHGVMNTDNVQVAGETIDFGPCAFMEAFDPATVFSSIDHGGRYAYGNQPSIGNWNSARLGQALLPLLGEDQDAAVQQAEASLAVFADEYNARFVDGFLLKFGWPAGSSGASSESSREFVNASFATMADQAVDFTLFFRRLTQVAGGEAADGFLELFDDLAVGTEWLSGWQRTLAEVGGPDVASMRGRNPIFIPRNHRVEEVIQAGFNGDFGPFERMNEVWSKPFEEQPEHAELERPASAEERIRETFCGT